MAIPCHEISSLAQTYLDGELADRDLHDFESHIAGCRECEELVQAETTFHRLIRNELAAPPAPDVLRKRIQLALDGEDEVAAKASRRARMGWILPGSSLVAAAAALIVFVTDSLAPVGPEVAGGEPRVAVQQFEAQSSGQPLPAERVVRPVVPTPVIELSESASGRTDGDDTAIDAQTLRRAAARFVGVPVELPGFEALVVRLRSCHPAMVDDRRAAVLAYDVGTPGGWSGMVLYVMDARNLELGPGGERRTLNGREVVLKSVRGKPGVLFKNAQGIGYLFTADLTESALLDVVANSGLLR
jgi:mycothiol system anti-sigma-R factor